MAHEQTTEQLTRRQAMAGFGAAAVATAAGAAFARAEGSQGSGSDTTPSKRGKPDEPDVKNPMLAHENPSAFDPPGTDSGDVKPFWYAFELGHNKVSEGGWARQVTVKDLPISTTIAGVNMRLKRGAIRELHWHQSAEWAYMIYGRARITAVDADSRAYVQDLGVGDLWYFPAGVPHSIQGTGDDGCEFLLAFDDGAFSEFETFLITDWMAHTPPEVLAKNFGLPEATFDEVPKHELYIFNAPLPASLEDDRRAATGPAGGVPSPFDYRLLAAKPDVEHAGGEVRIVDSKRFPVSTTIAAAHVRLRPGGLRELHWHPNADEWQYYIKGRGRMTVFAGGGKARTMDFRAGDVGYVQQTLPHYVENTGDADLEFLELFKSSYYQDVSLRQWVSHLPPGLVAAHLKIDPKVIAGIAKSKPVVVPV